MQVILKQDVKGQGKKGQMVNVSDGYARNYLLPRGLAEEATKTNINILKGKRESLEYKVKTETAEAQAIAERMESFEVVIKAKAGDGGRLFGSVTSKEIAEKIKSEFDIDIEKKKIVVEDIRQYGTYGFTVKVYTGIQVQMFVVVGE